MKEGDYRVYNTMVIQYVLFFQDMSSFWDLKNASGAGFLNQQRSQGFSLLAVSFRSRGAGNVTKTVNTPAVFNSAEQTCLKVLNMNVYAG